MGKNHCIYNSEWSKEFTWVRPGGNRFDAYCILCKKSFSITGQGKTALKTHSRGKSHCGLEKQLVQQPTFHFPKKNVVPVVAKDVSPAVIDKEPQSQDNPQDTAEVTRNVSGLYIKSDVIKAEALYSLAIISSHSSLRTGETIASIFPILFPDSEIAGRFKSAKDKISYITTFGWGPYIAERTIEKINRADFFALSFKF